MAEEKRTQDKRIHYEVKRVYIGKKPIGTAFEKVIEHVLEKNIKNEIKDKHTQA